MHELLSDIKDIASTVLSTVSTIAILWKLILSCIYKYEEINPVFAYYLNLD